MQIGDGGLTEMRIAVLWHGKKLNTNCGGPVRSQDLR